MPSIIGQHPFTDGTTRDIYEDATGQQFILGNAGERLYGAWLPSAD